MEHCTASSSWDQGRAVCRSSGSDEDIDSASAYDVNIGTTIPSGNLSGNDIQGLAQHLQSLGDLNRENWRRCQ